MFHRPNLWRDWNESGQRLQLITEGDTERRDGFDAELAEPVRRSHGKETQNTGDPFLETFGTNTERGKSESLDGQSSELIHSLIVCTKAFKVPQALSAIKHRLHKESVILFLQNGMGITDQVTREVFPDPETRPHYMLGINSHGMHATDDPFTTVHAGFGTISLGILPHERDRAPAPYAPTLKFKPHREGNWEGAQVANPTQQANPDPDAPSPATSTFRWTPNHRYLLRTLLRTPAFCASAFSPPDLLQLQLEKLAANCIINPLTVMLDARNGSVLYNYSLTRVIRLLISEISLVIRSLPELQYIPNVEHRFDPGRLETMVVGIANRTRDNISSMLADVRAGRQTEIDYINGWVVKKGEEQDIRCLMNYMLMHMVKGKRGVVQFELGEGIPFVSPGEGEEAVKLRDEKLGEDL